ncbi:MAG: hypothetical protein LAO19_14280 [Acidobacteriia bacterium]|nr:hypothetical protein [Terriglobia bacterium]
MSDSLIVQFVGYEVHAADREYRFSVRENKAEPREFTLTIASSAFNARRARFQDAPDICSLRLRRELAADANHPPNTHFQITDEELDDYRGRHSPRQSQSPYKKKQSEEY